MNPIRISPTLGLALSTVTATIAVLARKGSGKTYFGKVLAEELFKAGQQVVLFDPVGVCWGLRADADGEGSGLPFLILGGDHGDVPLDPGSGEAVAKFLVASRRSVVLDLGQMSNGQMKRFVADLGEELYRTNRAPLHLILDEADMFAPQRPMEGEQRMLGAIDKIVRRGRAEIIDMVEGRETGDEAAESRILAVDSPDLRDMRDLREAIDGVLVVWPVLSEEARQARRGLIGAIERAGAQVKAKR